MHRHIVIELSFIWTRWNHETCDTVHPGFSYWFHLGGTCHSTFISCCRKINFGFPWGCSWSRWCLQASKCLSSLKNALKFLWFRLCYLDTWTLFVPRTLSVPCGVASSLMPNDVPDEWIKMMTNVKWRWRGHVTEWCVYLHNLIANECFNIYLSLVSTLVLLMHFPL